MLACGHVSGTESTALKRRSNGAAEMKADRVERACLSRSVGFILLFSTLRPGTMSLGRGDESVAPVFLEASANNGDSCAGGDPVSKASPGCAQYAAAGCCTIPRYIAGCQSYARYTTRGESADLSHFGKLLEDSVQWRRPGEGCEGCEGKIYRFSWTARLSLSQMLCSGCCDLWCPGPPVWPCAAGRGAGEAWSAPVSFASCLT